MPSSFGGALLKNPRRRVNQAMRWLQNLHGTMSSSKKGRPSSPNTPLQPQISACEKCGLVQISGANSLQQFAAIRPSWTKEDALEIEVLAQSEDELRFNVTRCRYAEMYEALGLSELGAVLSCGRDAALIEGFNSGISLERPQTILGGALPAEAERKEAGKAGEMAAGAAVPEA